MGCGIRLPELLDFIFYTIIVGLTQILLLIQHEKYKNEIEYEIRITCDKRSVETLVTLEGKMIIWLEIVRVDALIDIP